ncbi:hypothetical protein FQA39_LY07701 [Lamprigera yunnana]|nr:hypothetical protein FQA39_LY07701 [Lamprigera yunnana]
METRSTKQKPRETVEQGKIQILQEEALEEPTKIEERTKINQHKEERIQVCEDLKEQKREIVNYINEKIKTGSGTGHNVITNYSKIEREAPKFHPSKNQKLQTYLEVIKKQIGNQYDQAMEDAIIREAMRGETDTWYRTKIGEYRNFKQFRKGFMKNYWGTKEESVMKSELYGTKCSHSLRQLEEKKLDESTIVHILAGQVEEEIYNKVMIDETKNMISSKGIEKGLMEANIIIEVTNTGNTTTADKKGIIIIILGVVFTGINSIAITIIEIKDFRIIGDGITTEINNTKIHTDLENRRGREHTPHRTTTKRRGRQTIKGRGSS